MIRGQVYVWVPEPGNSSGGRVELSILPLANLQDCRASGGIALTGRFVTVKNGASILEPGGDPGQVRIRRLGGAVPGADGNLIFEPGSGGDRVDKAPLEDAALRERYVAASRFGEVNTYFHLDRMAAYLNDLLAELDAPPLPPVIAVVHAHAAGVEEEGVRDGVMRNGRGVPFQGGHYRLPARRYNVPEPHPVDPRGEIHLGPGRSLQKEGALAVFSSRGCYRANASHNAGIIYHEYGHHVARHLADFRANRLRPPDRQDNRKPAIDEGTSDYWAAALLETPHIWALHWGHDEHRVHRRSLVSEKTMTDFDGSPKADPHSNGTIWAAGLWEFRIRIAETDPELARRADRLVLEMLRTLGRVGASCTAADRKAIRRTRSQFGTGLSALLRADEELERGRFREDILHCFGKRGIAPAALSLDVLSCRKEPGS